MKILRVLRRRKIKLSFIFLLFVFFIFNTYAWMTTDINAETNSLVLNVSSWEVAFVINGEEVKSEEYTFDIDEFYPGITPIEKKVEVWNIGGSNALLKYEVTEIYLYGMQIWKKTENEENPVPESIGEETKDESGQTTANLFGNRNAMIFDENNTYYKVLLEQKENAEDNTYQSFSLKYPTPFNISYTYGSTCIGGSGRENEVGSRSEMVIRLEWNNNELNNKEDTKLGNLVYDFENAKDANGNLLHEGEPALRIVARVTAKKDEQSDNSSDNSYAD